MQTFNRQEATIGTQEALPHELTVLLDASLPESRITALLVDHYTPSLGTGEFTWVGELADVVAERDLPATVLRSALSDLAWKAREAGFPVPSPGTEYVGRAGLARAIFEGQRLRFDYRFETLMARCRGWLVDFPHESLITALMGYASGGLRKPDARRYIDAALASVDADWRTRHICLHAAWFVTERAVFANLVLEISNDMITRGEGNSNVYYRRAGALRRLERFDQAQEEIDRAIEMLTAGNNSVHQDYVRERELIITTRDLYEGIHQARAGVIAEMSDGLELKIKAATSELEKKVDDANRTLSDGLLKIVEILGLFITIVGFLIGAGFSALKERTFWESVGATTLFVVGSLIFFALLRLVVRYRR